MEANPKYFELIHRERSCALVPTCISNNDGEYVEFAMATTFGGIINTHKLANTILNRSGTVLQKIRCVSIGSQLLRYGIDSIDYLNLDVEGGELNVLEGIDWNTTTVKILTVEISSATGDGIDLFLKGKGFSEIDPKKPVNGLPKMSLHNLNKVYVHESVQFGNPEEEKS